MSFDFDRYKLVENKKCQATLDKKDLFLTHDCDSVPGASGSPILQDGKVVGIHQGYSQKLGKNTASLIQRENVRQESFAQILRQTDRLEVSCGDNCSKHCRRKVLGNWVPNPICEVACNAERGLDCALEDASKGVVSKVLNDIHDQAIRDGWTKQTCLKVGTPPILLASAVYITPICTAAGVSTVGWGVPACVTAITGTIVTAVCTQLCHDRILLDCKDI